MMSGKRSAKKELSEDAKRCQELYEEICELQRHFGWSMLQLCKTVESGIEDDDVIKVDTEESSRAQKLEAKLKKTFQRKSWEKDKASHRTRKLLEVVRDSIYLTEQYRDSELYGSNVPLSFRKGMAKIARKVQKKVDDLDYE